MGLAAAGCLVNRFRIGIALALVAAFAFVAFRSRASFLLASGFALGAALQRSRLCFASAFRDLFQKRESRGMVGVLTALAVGSVGYLVVFGAQLPDPSG